MLLDSVSELYAKFSLVVTGEILSISRSEKLGDNQDLSSTQARYLRINCSTCLSNMLAEMIYFSNQGKQNSDKQYKQKEAYFCFHPEHDSRQNQGTISSMNVLTSEKEGDAAALISVEVWDKQIVLRSWTIAGPNNYSKFKPIITAKLPIETAFQEMIGLLTLIRLRMKE